MTTHPLATFPSPAAPRVKVPPPPVGRTVGSANTSGSDLPNPWHKVAPPCPYDPSHPPAVVYLWHPDPGDGYGKWLCSPCARRFSLPDET